MPASLGHLLFLGSILLLPGAAIEPPAAPPQEARAVRDDSISSRPEIASGVIPSLAARGVDWRISEADAAEEDVADPDDSGLAVAGPSSDRLLGDPRARFSSRRSVVPHPMRFRSPILRC